MDRIDNWGKNLLNLNENYDSLASFQEVSEWVEKAEHIIQEGDELRVKMLQDATRTKEKLTRAENEYNNKSYLKRIFGSRKDVEELEKEYRELISETGYIDKIKTMLRQKIDGIPKSRNEKVEMLRKLNLRKKELNINKRVANESIRQVNASARQARAKLSGVSGKGFVGTAARISRASITNAKEEALRPHEAEKAEIEAELASVENEALRISRIISTDVVPTIIRKCKYCCRELGLGSVCPGCGAAN